MGCVGIELLGGLLGPDRYGRTSRTQEHVGQLRVQKIDEQQYQHGCRRHLHDTHLPRPILVGAPRRTGVALGADVLPGLVFPSGILGPFAAQLGTALFTGLLLGVIITRDIVELVRVLLKRGKA